MSNIVTSGDTNAIHNKTINWLGDYYICKNGTKLIIKEAESITNMRDEDHDISLSR